MSLRSTRLWLQRELTTSGVVPTPGALADLTRRAAEEDDPETFLQALVDELAQEGSSSGKGPLTSEQLAKALACVDARERGFVAPVKVSSTDGGEFDKPRKGGAAGADAEIFLADSNRSRPVVVALSETPSLVWDASRRAFRASAVRARALGDADSRRTLFLHRYRLAWRRVSRSPLFRTSRFPSLAAASAAARGGVPPEGLTELGALGGRGGERKLVLGFLSGSWDSGWALEDPSGRVTIAGLETAARADGHVCEGHLLVAAGKIDPATGAFHVSELGHPPAEPRPPRAELVAARGDVGGAIAALPSSDADADLFLRDGASRGILAGSVAALSASAALRGSVHVPTPSPEGSLLVCLSDVWVDSPACLRRLALVLAGHERVFVHAKAEARRLALEVSEAERCKLDRRDRRSGAGSGASPLPPSLPPPSIVLCGPFLRGPRRALAEALWESEDMFGPLSDPLAPVGPGVRAWEGGSENKDGDDSTVATGMLDDLLSAAGGASALGSSALGFSGDPTRRLRAGLTALGNVFKVAAPTLAREASVVLVPGPGDPGAGVSLPRPPLPRALTRSLAEALPHLSLAPNPARIRVGERDVVVFRHGVRRLLSGLDVFKGIQAVGDDDDVEEDEKIDEQNQQREKHPENGQDDAQAVVRGDDELMAEQMLGDDEDNFGVPDAKKRRADGEADENLENARSRPIDRTEVDVTDASTAASDEDRVVATGDAAASAEPSEVPHAPASSSQWFAEVIATVIQQAHLCPAPLSHQPVAWELDHVLRLPTPPDCLVLADDAPAAAIDFGGCACLCPGPLAAGAFCAYAPREGGGEICDVPADVEAEGREAGADTQVGAEAPAHGRARDGSVSLDSGISFDGSDRRQRLEEEETKEEEEDEIVDLDRQLDESPREGNRIDLLEREPSLRDLVLDSDGEGAHSDAGRAPGGRSAARRDWSDEEDASDGDDDDSSDQEAAGIRAGLAWLDE